MPPTMRMRRPSLLLLLPLLLLLSLPVAMVGAESEAATADTEEVFEPWKDYKHAPTPCDVVDCVAGGCHFEGCAEPVRCTGGLCLFKRCKKATCEGGACLFDATDNPLCPGGGCRFENMQVSLKEGYCQGGACTLDGKAHPKSFAATLSE